jgi:hypothetical protein
MSSVISASPTANSYSAVYAQAPASNWIAVIVSAIQFELSAEELVAPAPMIDVIREFLDAPGLRERN